jgi:hypothetical protein
MASAACFRAPSARIFAPMMAPPKIVWRDLVLMLAGITAGLAAEGNATRICGSERRAHTTGFVNV